MASSKQPPKGTPETKAVIALRAGYYGQYREAGERFEVPSELNASWFIDDNTVEKPADQEAGDLV